MYSSWLPAISQRIENTSKKNYVLIVVVSFSITVCCLVVAWCYKCSVSSKPKWGHKRPLGGYTPLPWRRHWLDPFILFFVFKFKFKFIDFEKTKFKFKFIDFAKVEFEFKFVNISQADSNSKFKFNPTLLHTVPFNAEYQFL